MTRMNLRALAATIALAVAPMAATAATLGPADQAGHRSLIDGYASAGGQARLSYYVQSGDASQLVANGRNEIGVGAGSALNGQNGDRVRERFTLTNQSAEPMEIRLGAGIGTGADLDLEILWWEPWWYQGFPYQIRGDLSAHVSLSIEIVGGSARSDYYEDVPGSRSWSSVSYFSGVSLRLPCGGAGTDCRYNQNDNGDVIESGLLALAPGASQDFLLSGAASSESFAYVAAVPLPAGGLLLAGALGGLGLLQRRRAA
ncbi:VPLPA-CTERM sorting domain-containing protein [Rubellimicrobium roseum]|uniref:VPLPA-CTERM sorting domain-containing protein n=1 Tax=Rubellimicrobium roseum TaxID=687525 RepID=A0A5C4NJF5_9RHOB|nr:VPLPA-CTERM sorting domain-containing protein [Rubellimicrobium roseum]TNC74924.1 VPLPA-CTERM sorting domain-containing protein [Rubellimicrobium roseum]